MGVVMCNERQRGYQLHSMQLMIAVGCFVLNFPSGKMFLNVDDFNLLQINIGYIYIKSSFGLLIYLCASRIC